MRAPLLFAALLFLSGCSGDESNPAESGGATQLEIRASIADSTEGYVRAGELIVRAFRLAPDGSIADSVVDRFDLPDSAFALNALLDVDPADRYRVATSISGVQIFEGQSSDNGILYHGESEIGDVRAGTQRVLPISLRNLVPKPVVEVFPQVGYTLEWNRIVDAESYELRQEIDGVVEILTTDQRELFIPFPPGIRAKERGLSERRDDRVVYQVRSRLPSGLRGAFSDRVDLTVPGDIPPGRVIDLAADPDAATTTSIRLTWTAPGDDGGAGQATEYDLRYDRSEIDEENFLYATRFERTGEPDPPGSREIVIIGELEPETIYYFALKTADEVPNLSELSNIVMAATLSTDSLPPTPVLDLAVLDAGETWVELGWTAPDEDGPEGGAARYDLRYDTIAISLESFETAIGVENPPSPRPGGSEERFTVDGLFPETLYYFALRSVDARGNVSEISNVANELTPDQRSPAAVDDLVVRGANQTTIFLSWTATGDDGTDGTAESYDLRISGEVLTEANFDSAAVIPDLPPPRPGGQNESMPIGDLAPDSTYYFAIKATDDWGNISQISNVASGTTDILLQKLEK